MELGGLGESLMVSAYGMLKLLEIGVTVVGDDYDPLCGLNRELKFIAGNNILEAFHLIVMHKEDISSLIESEDWDNFDSVITESGSFPMLRRVSVEIWWRKVSRRDLEDQEDILTKDIFPRLAERNAVQFLFHSQTL